MKRKRRVFIIHRVMLAIQGPEGQVEWHSRHDYEAAKEYGELVDVLQTADFHGDREHFMQVLGNALEDFGDEDSILCTGDPLGLLAAGLVLMAVNTGWSRIRVLRWNRHRNKYVPFDIRARSIALLQERAGL